MPASNVDKKPNVPLGLFVGAVMTVSVDARQLDLDVSERVGSAVGESRPSVRLRMAVALGCLDVDVNGGVVRVDGPDPGASVGEAAFA